jgi:hypothetical protein
MWAVLLVGILSGVQVRSQLVCTLQLSAMLVILLVCFGMTLWFQPAINRVLMYYQNTTSFVSLLSCVLMIIGIRTDSLVLLDVSRWCLFVLSLTSIVKLLLDMLYIACRLFGFILEQRSERLRDQELLAVLVTPVAASSSVAAAGAGLTAGMAGSFVPATVARTATPPHPPLANLSFVRSMANWSFARRSSGSAEGSAKSSTPRVQARTTSIADRHSSERGGAPSERGSAQMPRTSPTSNVDQVPELADFLQELEDTLSPSQVALNNLQLRENEAEDLSEFLSEIEAQIQQQQQVAEVEAAAADTSTSEALLQHHTARRSTVVTRTLLPTKLAKRRANGEFGVFGIDDFGAGDILRNYGRSVSPSTPSQAGSAEVPNGSFEL